jgi:hypothetical protein
MAGGVTCRASLPQEGGPRCTPCLYRQAILGRIRPILVSHAVDLPLPPPLTTTAEPSRRRRWPSTACASLSARLQLGRRRAGRGHGGRPRRPGGPSRAAACPPPRSLTSLRPDTADAGTHGQRTPTGDRTPNTGDRPADTWTLRRPHRTLDTGRVDRQAWTLVARTGHWTPDAGRGRGQGDDGTAGIQTSWTTTPGDRALGRPTVFLWTGPAGLGSPCRLGSKVTCRRETASRTTMQRSVAPPA